MTDKMNKIKRYIDIQLPVTACTLRCHYCYITQHQLFSVSTPKLKYSAAQIRKALSKQRLGGVCHISLCGMGETLLLPEITEIVGGLLEEGHYIMVVTNATVTKIIKEMMESYSPELKNRLCFKISYHFLELKKRNILEKFFETINYIRQNGCSFTLELPPSDELIPYIDEVKEYCMKYLGALCHVTVARDENVTGYSILTKLSLDEYKKIWGQFDSELFDFKIDIFNQKRKEFCYIGKWGGLLNLGTGELRACDRTFLKQNIMDEPDAPIDWRPKAKCNKAHCHNGHSWLGLGMIPDLETPTYSSMRDRVDKNGNHWLQPEMREFLSHKLAEENELLPAIEKAKAYNRALLSNMVWNGYHKLLATVDKCLKK